ncbi:MAG: phospho-N-acetylmuramoyl-pentapeptide-transferase [Bacteroidaceae bacterium]|nr:phospho-N-acetylmuramoyl-pentapeptide-transferase [Bacteroidaceae bacterium]MBO5951563.1 phospho-N-acetylmuramoyl-pentapeptide-transferase [Bacteroidaceae bacterium]
MLYSLFQYLQDKVDIPGAGMFTYVTFRSLFALVLSIVISAWFGSKFIDYLKRHSITETQRDEKTDPFNVGKVGVPTMGGVIIIVAILVPCLLVGKLNNSYMLLMIITTILLGIIGFADDYIKTFKKKKDGLNGWFKVAGQVTLGLIVGLTLRYAPDVVINEKVETKIENNIEVVVKTPDVKSTRTTIPFFKNHNLNYADLFSWLGEPLKYKAGWIFFVILTVFVVTAVSNGSNLNDGMDGMAAGNSAIIGIALGVLAYVSSNVVAASHLDLMYIPGSQELVVFMCAFVGALIGFLWYNSYPAQIFMGDTGSLTIGGIIAVSAICIHKELLLPILCGIFLLESLSVILQKFYYKSGKKSGLHRRIWKRTPIHDHFRTSMEQVHRADPTSTVIFKGNDKKLQFETKITLRAWIISIGLAIITLLTLKIR